MNKIKLLYFSVISLLLLNLGTLYFVMSSNSYSIRSGKGGSERNLQDQSLRFLMDEIGYNDEQRKKCIDLLKSHRMRMKEIHTEIRMQHDQMFNDLEVRDTTAVGRIGDLYRQNELEIFRYFTGLRDIATKEQKIKFDIIIQEAMRIMPPPEHK
jgi:hypothetical protein